MSSIRSILNKIDDSTSEGILQREALITFAELGNLKANSLKAKIEEHLLYAQTDKSDPIPIRALAYNINSVRFFSADESEGMRDTVKSEVKMFLSGVRETALSAISSLVYVELYMLLNRADHSNEIEVRYVAFEGESPIRIDMTAWYQNIDSHLLKDKTEKVLTIVAFASAIDTKKMNLSAFLSMHQAQLSQGEVNQEDIIKELEYAKDKLDKSINSNPL